MSHLLEFVNYTAARQQGAIQICRLQIWEPSQSLFTALYKDKCLDKVYIKSVRGWCVTLLLLPPCGQKLTHATNMTFCVWHTVRFTQHKHYVFIQPRASHSAAAEMINDLCAHKRHLRESNDLIIPKSESLWLLYKCCYAEDKLKVEVWQR